MVKKFILYILVLLIIPACHKDHTTPQAVDLSGPGLLILNEGNFTYGNASISFYNIESHTIINNAFYKANGLHLGDIAQSALDTNGYLLIVVNNSGKIVKTNPTSLKQIAQLKGLVSPRYITLLAPDKAIVTDLYSPYLTVFDPQTMTVTEKIFVGHSTERILVHESYIYTISWNNDSMLLKIDSHTLSPVDSLTVGYQPNSMVFDKNGKLWILCDGGLYKKSQKQVKANLICIDPLSMQVIKNLQFPATDLSPSHLVINNTADTLYFLLSSWTPTDNPLFGIYRMAINDSLPSTPWIKQKNHTFYSLWYIQQKKWLAVTDAANFTTNGQVLIYDTQANLLATIPVGIIPGFVMYKK